MGFCKYTCPNMNSHICCYNCSEADHCPMSCKNHSNPVTPDDCDSNIGGKSILLCTLLLAIAGAWIIYMLIYQN